jgi:hypothetical protein
VTVVVNELDVVPPAGPPPGEPASATAPSPERTAREVEQAARLRDERARRLKAY